jgi:acetyl-CoA acetyltransferase
MNGSRMKFWVVFRLSMVVLLTVFLALGPSWSRQQDQKPPQTARTEPQKPQPDQQKPDQGFKIGVEVNLVAVPVTVPYVRYSIRSAHWWLARCLADLLKQSGLRKDDIDGFCISSFTLSPDTAIGLTQHLGLSPRWLDHVPFGGASAVVALRRAARAVQAGDADIVACLAGDTNHVDSFRLTLANFSQFARDAVYPYGAGGPNASFAFLTAYYMRNFGATREDFGKLCVAQRTNALKFPHALFKKPLTLEEYLKAREIADPLRLFDCVMPCAGADGFLVMSDERATKLGVPYARLLATIERHNAFASDPVQMRAGWAIDRAGLYEQAGAGPEDMDLVQTYDDYPVISVMQIEDLGFCGKGEGADFIRRHTFTWDGSFPLNTSGGQLSVGQAGAAGGALGMVEALRQLTRQAEGRQVKDAKLGLVSGFGMINFDRGLGSGAVILGN